MTARFWKVNAVSIVLYSTDSISPYRQGLYSGYSIFRCVSVWLIKSRVGAFQGLAVLLSLGDVRIWTNLRWGITNLRDVRVLIHKNISSLRYEAS